VMEVEDGESWSTSFLLLSGGVATRVVRGGRPRWLAGVAGLGGLSGRLVAGRSG
jgi:hypothetical protein